MNTIYAKYNRERLPMFQTATIIKNDKGKKTIEKYPLNVSAKEHIYSIASNYHLLTNTYPDLKIAKSVLRNDKVIMSYIEGDTLEAKILNAIIYKDKSSFYYLIHKYVNFIDSLSVNNKNCNSIVDKEYYKVFGKSNLDSSYIMRIANIDIGFDNLIVDNNNNLHIIDYEWVFNFHVETLFVVYRAINIFINKHNSYLKYFLDKNDLMISLNLDSKMQKTFDKMEREFLKYVHGTNNHYLDKYKKDILYINDKLANTIYTTKLYINTGEGFKEEMTVKKNINISSKHLFINLELPKHDGLFNSFRWDPLDNLLCKVKIISMSFQLMTGENKRVDLSILTSNGIVDENGWFIFYTFDPMIFIPIQGKFISLKIETELEIISNIELERKYNIICASLSEMERFKNHEIEQKDHQLSVQAQELEQKDQQLSVQAQELEQMDKKLNEKNILIEQIINSNSWHLTKPFRFLGQTLRHCIILTANVTKTNRLLILCKVLYNLLKTRRYTPRELLHYFKKGVQLLKKEGMKVLIQKAMQKTKPAYKVLTHNPDACNGGVFDQQYYQAERVINHNLCIGEEHYLNHGMLEGTAPNRYIAYKRIAQLPLKPKISLLMPVYNSLPDHLIKAVESIINQVYDNWELCIQDDGSTSDETIKTIKELSTRDERITVEFSNINCGISAATNKALTRASGEFVAMMDHDDLISPGCLAEVVAAHNLEPDVNVFYTDQLYIDDSGTLTGHQYKPDWSPWFFRGVMFVGHLLVVRRSLAEDAGGFDSKFDFVQDFEFMLRLSEQTDKIVHISKALYQWRQTASSVAGGGKRNIDFGRLQADAVNAHLKRLIFHVRGKKNPVHPHRLVLEPSNSSAKIPAKVFFMPPTPVNNLTTSTALQNLVSNTEHQNIDWIQLTHSDMEDPSKIIDMIDECDKEFIVFLNARCQPIQDNWLTSLLSYASLSGIGAVGPLIIDAMNKVVSAGMVITSEGIKPAMPGMDADLDGYAGSLSCLREVSVLSPDCVVLRAKLFNKRERQLLKEFGLAYTIVDAFIQGNKIGLSSLFVPFVKLRWTGTPGSCLDEVETGKRFWMDYRRRELREGDPYYNQNLSSEMCNYSSQQSVV